VTDETASACRKDTERKDISAAARQQNMHICIQ
jgi:hypothetical protein